MVDTFFLTFSSLFDTITMVWKEIDSNVLIQRIFLSDPKKKSEQKARDMFKEINEGSSSLIGTLESKILNFFSGKEEIFDLQSIDFDQCFRVQKEILLAEFGIPRGWISTYKRISDKVGIPNGARVVGNALARNPFPIVIPCHRAIKTNGELGGFQGGIEMKRALLEMEGIKFSRKGKVIMDKIHY
ncbi:MAG: methylated-DNA--[protein]-cysteine S-methyltransferase [Candidatus Hermodarchaeota archaeon]